MFNSTLKQYFSYIVAVSFISVGNRSLSTRRKPSTSRKSLTNFITNIVMIGTYCINSNYHTITTTTASAGFRTPEVLCPLGPEGGRPGRLIIMSGTAPKQNTVKSKIAPHKQKSIVNFFLGRKIPHPPPG